MYIDTLEIAGFYPAIKGMRNPLNSWHLSDSYTENGVFVLGDKDKDLALRLINSGKEHRKFLRMIQVWFDANMPRYFWQEMDTYKFSTKNSCSTMHTIMKRPITINDFCVDSKIKEILTQKTKNKKKYIFKCNLPRGKKEEFKIIERNNYEYKISNTGKIYSLPKVVIDSMGRIRAYSLKELIINQNSGEYFSVRLGGRNGKLEPIHKLIAQSFIPNPNNLPFINHKDGDKGNCSIDNLEWCTQQENNRHAIDTGLKIVTPYAKYKAYITNKHINYSDINKIKEFYSKGYTQKQIGDIFGIKQAQVSTILKGDICKEADLYEEAYVFDSIIKRLNELRILYLESKDYSYIIRMKRLLPESFLQLRTVSTNYEEIANMYHQRKNHRLKEEWQEIFCEWVQTLPYASELIIGGK